MNMTTTVKLGLTGMTILAAAGCGTLPDAPAERTAVDSAANYRGKMQVVFEVGATGVGSSDGEGLAAMQFTEFNDATTLGMFAGALPGFSDWGAACAFVDLPTSTVRGTMVYPDGTTAAFSEVFDEVSVEVLPNNDGFTIHTALGEDRWTYRMQMTPRFIGDAGEGVFTHVVVHRSFSADGEPVFSDRGGGGFAGSPVDLLDTGQRRVSLRPAPRLMIDAGEDQTIRRGESTLLSATVWGGNDAWNVYWSSPSTLDDAEHSEPLATPKVTTTYHVVARGPAGEQAEDVVTVYVEQQAVGAQETDAEPGRGPPAWTSWKLSPDG